MNLLSRCRLKLVNYFDSLISKIDLDVELVLANDIISESQDQALRNRQHEFISIIKEVQKANLDHLESIDIETLTLLDEASLDVAIFSQFCFFVDKKFDCMQDALGYLVVVDRYLNEDEVKVFRSIIRFNNQGVYLGSDNVFFKLKDAKTSCWPQIIIKLEEFDAANPVIRLNSGGFFFFDTLMMTDFCIDTILPSARFAFTNIKCLVLKPGDCEADELVKTIEALVDNGSRLEKLKIYFRGSLKPNAFSRLQEIKFKALKSLELYSKCEFLSRSLLVGLGAFHELSMAIDSDTAIESEPFIDLTDLGILELKICQLMSTFEVKSSIFRGLNNLESLKFTFENSNRNVMSPAVGKFKSNDYSSKNAVCPAILGNALACLNLKSLALEKFQVDEGVLDHMTNLEELSLINVEPFAAIFTNSFKQASKLRSLVVVSDMMAEIRPQLLDGLASLERLNLSGNGLTQLDKNTFNHLPSLKCIDLTENGLESFECDVFSSVEELSLAGNCIAAFGGSGTKRLDTLTKLDLSKNSLDMLNGETFTNLVNLERLSLQFNKLANIESNTFAALPKLTDLDLSDNKLSHLDACVFSAMSSLTKLALAANKIESLAPKTFINLTTLQELYLYSNLIAEIGDETFAGLTSLTTLYLNGNKLTHIRSHSFSVRNCPNLTELNLNFNFINRIEADAFVGLASLRELHLNGNSIFSIVPGTLSSLSNLHNLDLRNNRIRNLEPGTFLGLVSLKYLNLSKNKIEHIRKDMFAHALSRLESLFLRCNLIASIEAKAFASMKRLEHVNLVGNPFDVDSRTDSLHLGLSESCRVFFDLL